MHRASLRPSWLLLVLALGLLSQSLPACGILFRLESPSGELREIDAAQTWTIALRTLYSLYFTIPVTDCFILTAEVLIEGQAWDNDQLLPLQPMNKLVWKEDYDEWSLVAAGIFRATERGLFRVRVSYQDEQLEEPLVQELVFRAE